jgi:hypothetical protein
MYTKSEKNSLLFITLYLFIEIAYLFNYLSPHTVKSVLTFTSKPNQT